MKNIFVEGNHKFSYNIRHINDDEIALLDDFLYEAIYIPEDVDAPPRDYKCTGITSLCARFR